MLTKALVILVLVLQALDLASTVYALKHFRGQVFERNPLVRWLQLEFGTMEGTAIAKVAFAAALWWAYKAGGFTGGYVWILVAVAALYVWVVASNLKLIAKHRGGG